MRLPVDPSDIVRGILAGDPDRLGERIVDMFLTVRDLPAGAALAGMVRSAVSHEPSSRMLSEFMATSVLTPVVKQLRVHHAKLRVTYVASQLFGLALARYILGLEPLASANRRHVVTDIAPTIQRTSPTTSPTDPCEPKPMTSRPSGGYGPAGVSMPIGSCSTAGTGASMSSSISMSSFMITPGSRPGARDGSMPTKAA